MIHCKWPWLVGLMVSLFLLGAGSGLTGGAEYAWDLDPWRRVIEMARLGLLMFVVGAIGTAALAAVIAWKSSRWVRKDSPPRPVEVRLSPEENDRLMRLAD